MGLPVTERLTLREFTAADLPDLVRLDTDPRVMRYIGDGRALAESAVSDVLRRVQRYYTLYPDLGVWAAQRRVDGAFLGWFCLKYIPRTVEVEVGYRLMPDAWGNGYATEGASALVRYGFEEVGLQRIVGLTHPQNAASQHVLRKAGLRDAGYGHYYGLRLRYFVATAGPTLRPVPAS
jgi:RimJ/RimL family protein N-acetyltransferase